MMAYDDSQDILLIAEYEDVLTMFFRKFTSATPEEQAYLKPALSEAHRLMFDAQIRLLREGCLATVENTLVVEEIKKAIDEGNSQDVAWAAIRLAAQLEKLAGDLTSKGLDSRT